MTDESDKREPLAGCLDAMTSVLHAWDQYTSTTDAISRATWLITLNNHMSDLRSFHPDWDFETDTMPWSREE